MGIKSGCLCGSNCNATEGVVLGFLYYVVVCGVLWFLRISVPFLYVNVLSLYIVILFFFMESYCYPFNKFLLVSQTML